MQMSKTENAERRRAVFTDLDAALVQHFGHRDAIPASAREQAAAWQAQRVQLKALHEDRQRCARAFGEARKAGQDLAPLKAAMQEVTDRLKAAEAQQRELEALLLAHGLGATEEQPDSASTRPSLPPRLTAQSPGHGEPTAWSVSTYHSKDQSDWDRYVDQHPRATAYHYSVWRPLIADCFKQRDCSLLARTDEGRIVGVLPLIRLTSRLFGDFAVSMPYFNYGGPLADHVGIERDLLDHAARQAQSLGLKHMEIRSLEPISDWPVRSEKVAMIRSLPDRVETLERELGSKVRAQVRRAEREGPQVHFGREALLDAFYTVFAHNMRDLGTPVYSRRFFAEILARWPDSELACLYLNGRPVGAAFLLGHRETLEIPWASTLREFNPLGINMLMYWEVLKRAIQKNYDYFDFGRSSQDSGTYRFKQQWGAIPLANHWQYWLPAGTSMPALNPDNPRYRLLIRTWQNLPVALTKLMGPWIVRNLP